MVPGTREVTNGNDPSRGAFDVKLTPERFHEGAREEGLARMSIDKRFHGDLEGTSRGVTVVPDSGTGGLRVRLHARRRVSAPPSSPVDG
jgi:hypothetical protein